MPQCGSSFCSNQSSRRQLKTGCKKVKGATMRQHTNDIIVEQHGAVSLFDIRGDLTHLSEPLLIKALQNDSRQKYPRILLKIDKGAYINSGGIAMLIQFLAKTKQIFLTSDIPPI